MYNVEWLLEFVLHTNSFIKIFYINFGLEKERNNMNTEINFAGITMKNPVTLASGTCGYGRELSEFFDLSEIRSNYHKRNISKA